MYTSTLGSESIETHTLTNNRENIELMDNLENEKISKNNE